jgi:N-ethylmaleimide reductase
MGAPSLPDGFKPLLRKAFGGTFIASGGFDRDRAEAVLTAGEADLVAFGRPWLANPDLIARMKAGAALNATDFATFYTPGPKGYTDYPTL